MQRNIAGLPEGLEGVVQRRKKPQWLPEKVFYVESQWSPSAHEVLKVVILRSINRIGMDELPHLVKRLSLRLSFNYKIWTQRDTDKSPIRTFLHVSANREFVRLDALCWFWMPCWDGHTLTIFDPCLAGKACVAQVGGFSLIFLQI
jgi:hypothetical protein